MLLPWLFYPLILVLIQKIKKKKIVFKQNKDTLNLNICFVIAAFNEQTIFEKKIKNILDNTKNFKNTKILLISDGSTDNTNKLGLKYKKKLKNFFFIVNKKRSGKAYCHNLARSFCIKKNIEIMVFSDMETRYFKKTVFNLLNPFKDKKIGLTTGKIAFKNKNKNNRVEKSVNMYWKFEYFLRKLESDLNILSTASGANFAVRTKLLKKIPLDQDTDFRTPIDISVSNKFCKHVENSWVEDYNSNNAKQEFKTRIRMTSKNFYGTLSALKIKYIILRPKLFFSLYAHKILRWCTPYFNISLILISCFNYNLIISKLILFANSFFFVLVLIHKLNSKNIISLAAYNFLIANLGFFFGILKPFFFKINQHYQPTNKLN